MARHQDSDNTGRPLLVRGRRSPREEVVDILAEALWRVLCDAPGDGPPGDEVGSAADQTGTTQASARMHSSP